MIIKMIKKMINKIPISKVFIDKSMLNFLKSKNHSFQLNNYLYNENSITVGNLDRIDKFLVDKIKGSIFPPVKLREEKIYLPPHKRSGNCKYISTYHILDGRHRITTAIIFNEHTIDANIIN